MLPSSAALLFAAALSGAAPAETPSATKPRLAVTDLEVAGGIDPGLGRALSEAITLQIQSSGYFEVLSSKEIQTMVGQARQRALLGCNEESSCLAELAGALGARFLLGGSLARLGNAYQLSLQTLDSVKARPIARAVRIANDLGALREQLPFIVAEATATPMPPAPSHALPYAMMAGGTAIVIGAGFLGFLGLSDETSVAKELSLGTSQPSVLRPDSYYADAANRIRLEKTVALSGMVLGAALVGVGYFLNPKDSGGTRVALAPSSAGLGVAVAGVIP